MGIEDQVKKITVEEDGKKMDVIIAMTEEESRDRSYVDYMELAQREKTADYLRKKPERPESKVSDEDRRGAIREAIAYKNRKQSGEGKKFY